MIMVSCNLMFITCTCNVRHHCSHLWGLLSMEREPDYNRQHNDWLIYGSMNGHMQSPLRLSKLHGYRRIKFQCSDGESWAVTATSAFCG